MKDIHELLREKEMECARVQKEIDALRMVIPMIEGGGTVPEPEGRKQPEAAPAETTDESVGSTGTEGPIFSAVKSESSFWKRRR